MKEEYKSCLQRGTAGGDRALAIEMVPIWGVVGPHDPNLAPGCHQNNHSEVSNNLLLHFANIKPVLAIESL